MLTPRSRTSYHSRTDGALYQINFLALVPVKFQQKINLTLSNQIDPQISLPFSARTQY